MDNPREEWRELSTDEKDLVANLLKNDFPGRDGIANQILNAKVRMLDIDVLEFRVDTDQKVDVIHRVPVEAYCKDADGISIHALLHVTGGVVQEIEFFKDDNSAILKMPKGKDFRHVLFQTRAGIEFSPYIS
jgi:hypothetical protein